MTALDIRLDHGPAVEPGGEVQGVVTWSTVEQAETIELRLFWWTAGKGTRNLEVIDRLVLASPALHGERRFRFRLPEAPYSFSGTLITLSWGLELVAEPSGESVHRDLVVAPEGREVDVRVLREF